MRKREGLTERSVIKHQSLVHHLLAASQLSPLVRKKQSKTMVRPSQQLSAGVGHLAWQGARTLGRKYKHRKAMLRCVSGHALASP